MPEVGERYLGTVVKTTNFGAFVSLLPGKDGLLHISKLRALAGGKRVDNVEDVVSVGQKIQVQIAEIDDRGKLSLVPVVEDEVATSPRSDADAGRVTGRVCTDAVSDPSLRDSPCLTAYAGPSCKGGLRVVTEQMPGVRSAAVGVFVQVGSRDEAPQLNGASHFLEHLLFKGTPTRSAMDISAAFDEVGGEFNAFTAREYTCYHARVLDEDLPMALDVLGDMVTSSLITAEDVEAEREVILDEIAMHDDDPDDVVHNLFAATAWAGTPLAPADRRDGRVDQGAQPHQVKGYYERRYRPEVITVAVAGNVDHDDVVRRTRRAFCRNEFLAGDGRPAGPRRRRPVRGRCASARRRRRAPSSRSTSCSGCRGSPAPTPAATCSTSSSAALGGGPSSRLFQEVRERRGLAYSVYSFGLGYSDAGMVGVAAGSLPSKADELLRVVREELARVAESGLTEEEVARGKGQARGGLVLSLEDSGSRMTRLGEAELFQRRAAIGRRGPRELRGRHPAGRPRAGPRALHPPPDLGAGRPRPLTVAPPQGRMARNHSRWSSSERTPGG